MDRQTNIGDFKFGKTVSFVVARPGEFRFIRLTQTDRRCTGENILTLSAVEFFGTLSGGLRGQLSALQDECKVLRSASDRIGSLHSHMESAAALVSDLPQLRSTLRELQQKFQRSVDFPMQEGKPLDGIISHLTEKHGGNVHENRIATITSKSVFDADPRWALKNVADLTARSAFWSQNDLDQWVCWDFREMRIHPTHYTIQSTVLSAWILEGSVDRQAWIEIDRQTENEDLIAIGTASCAVSTAESFRCIRLTQTGTNRRRTERSNGDNCLSLLAVEFFGSISEELQSKFVI
jgi:hypothetical protein